MTFTPGRRLGPNTRAPRGTPVGYTAKTIAGGIIDWVPTTDLTGLPDPTVEGATLAVLDGAWVMAKILTDEATGDVLVDETTGDVLYDPA